MTIISYPTSKDDEYTARANAIIAKANTQVGDLEEELHDLCDTGDEEENELFVEPEEENMKRAAKPTAKTDEGVIDLCDTDDEAKTENKVRTEKDSSLVYY